MTTTQEMVMTMFTKEIIDKVKEQFKTGEKIILTEKFDITFRLHMPTANHINLEFFTNMFLDTEEEQELSGIGHGRIRHAITFIKPIGFFTQEKDNFTTNIKVTVVKEFEDDLDFLINAGKVPSNIETNKLSLEGNALLAAFSMEALIAAKKRKDTSFFANGLYCDIYLTRDRNSFIGMFTDGIPQVFLDDRYGFDGPIAAYFTGGPNTFAPMIQYKELFDKFMEMKLMTLDNRI